MTAADLTVPSGVPAMELLARRLLGRYQPRSSLGPKGRKAAEAGGAAIAVGIAAQIVGQAQGLIGDIALLEAGLDEEALAHLERVGLRLIDQVDLDEAFASVGQVRPGPVIVTDARTGQDVPEDVASVVRRVLSEIMSETDEGVA